MHFWFGWQSIENNHLRVSATLGSGLLTIFSVTIDKKIIKYPIFSEFSSGFLNFFFISNDLHHLDEWLSPYVFYTVVFLKFKHHFWCLNLNMAVNKKKIWLSRLCCPLKAHGMPRKFLKTKELSAQPSINTAKSRWINFMFYYSMEDTTVGDLDISYNKCL